MISKNNADRPHKRSAFAMSDSGPDSGSGSGSSSGTRDVLRDLRGARPPGLRKRSDFLSVQRTGVRQVTPGFILQVGVPSGDNQGGTGLRIGYTVSRKVGGAVDRNRVKRKLRELGRLVLARKASPGRDYVLIGRRAALHRPMDRMVGDLEKALKKLNVDA